MPLWTCHETILASRQRLLILRRNYEKIKRLNNFTNPLVKEINEKIAKLLEEYSDEYYDPYVFENRWENDRFLQDEEVAMNKRETNSFV